MAGVYRQSFNDDSPAQETELIGGTDQTKIGNTADKLKVDVAGFTATNWPSINRVDVNTTVTASGNSGTLVCDGMGTIGFTIQITAASGTDPVIQFYIEGGDDGVNWSRFIDTRRMTGVDLQRMQGARLAGYFYRFGWIVGGTNPSFTFTITSSLKGYMPRRYTVRNNYADVLIDTLGATSTVFSAADVCNVSLFSTRSDDGGSSTQYKVQGSNDNFTWVDVTGAVSQARDTTQLVEFQNKAFRNYRVKITAAANVANTLDLFWAGVG